MGTVNDPSFQHSHRLRRVRLANETRGIVADGEAGVAALIVDRD